MELQTEIFKDLFDIAVKNYLKKRLLSVHKKTTLFAWKFVDKYPRSTATSEAEIHQVVTSFLVNLELKLSELYEKNSRTSDLS